MPHCRRNLASSSLLPLLLLVSSPAYATYSIVATDQGTQTVGGAVASCVGPSSVTIVYGPAPGKGGINAQAAASAAGRDRGVQLLNMGTAPADIITQITSPSFDSQFNQRQYGIADLQGRAAAFTGTGTSVAQWRGSKQGTLATFTYSIQGNVLTTGAVVDQAETAFRGGGCDLAERLMLALEGGAQNGEGDDRCRPSVPADAASIEVDLAGQPAGNYLRLSNQNGTGKDAVVQLRSQFDTWRQTHPCMQPDAGTPDAGMDASSKDGSVTDVAGDRGDVSVGSDASDGAAGTGGTAGSAGTAGAAGSSGTAGTGGAAGMAGTGGAAGVGGSAGTAGSGGATGGAAGATGGAGGKGGAAGTSATGGAGGSGGATGTGGASGGSGGAAGTSMTGGRAGSGGSGGGRGGSAGSGGSTADDGGCSCRIGSGTNFNAAAAGVGSLLALMAAIRRRGGKRRGAARR